MGGSPGATASPERRKNPATLKRYTHMQNAVPENSKAVKAATSVVEADQDKNPALIKVPTNYIPAVVKGNMHETSAQPRTPHATVASVKATTVLCAARKQCRLFLGKTPLTPHSLILLSPALRLLGWPRSNYVIKRHFLSWIQVLKSLPSHNRLTSKWENHNYSHPIRLCMVPLNSPCRCWDNSKVISSTRASPLYSKCLWLLGWRPTFWVCQPSQF